MPAPAATGTGGRADASASASEPARGVRAPPEDGAPGCPGWPDDVEAEPEPEPVDHPAPGPVELWPDGPSPVGATVSEE